jgi:hypothetical protein
MTICDKCGEIMEQIPLYTKQGKLKSTCKWVCKCGTEKRTGGMRVSEKRTGGRDWGFIMEGK